MITLLLDASNDSWQLGVLTLPAARETDYKHEQAKAVIIICVLDSMGCKCKIKNIFRQNLWKISSLYTGSSWFQ